MKGNLIILFFGLLSVTISAQIDVETIKQKVTENPKANFYELQDKFKNSPSELTQEQLNQLYYGSKFLKNEYSIRDYNTDYESLWKKAGKRLSKDKAEKILSEAESKYYKNPLNKHVLKEMVNLYNAIGDEKKLNIVNTQIELMQKTIENSGDGKTEQSPICVIYPADVLVQLDRFSFVDRSKFEQKSKELSDGSILTMYKMGKEVYYVKLVGGYFFKDE